MSPNKASPVRGPVAVVVPRYKRELSENDRTALLHLTTHLGHYPIFWVLPKSLSIEASSFGVKRFGGAFFRSRVTYSELMMTLDFYRAFQGYEYVLIYQLDALVFSDQLLEWCGKGYDYIGAPWFVEDGPLVAKDSVGNGGLSLRNVAACIWTLELCYEWRSLLKRVVRPAPKLQPFRCWRRLVEWIKRDGPAEAFSRALLGVQHEIKTGWLGVEGFEDRFWSFAAASYNPSFRIPSAAEALPFSFENNPYRCFRRNGNKLPFGCHAWTRPSSLGFWKQFLIQ